MQLYDESDLAGAVAGRTLDEYLNGAARLGWLASCDGWRYYCLSISIVDVPSSERNELDL